MNYPNQRGNNNYLQTDKMPGGDYYPEEMEGGDRGGRFRGRGAPPPLPPLPKKPYWNSEEQWGSNQERIWRGSRDYRGNNGAKVEETEKEDYKSKYYKLLEDQFHKGLGVPGDKDQI